MSAGAIRTILPSRQTTIGTPAALCAFNALRIAPRAAATTWSGRPVLLAAGFRLRDFVTLADEVLLIGSTQSFPGT